MGSWRRIVGVAAAALFVTGAAEAQLTATWTGGGSTTFWSDAANWSTGAVVDWHLHTHLLGHQQNLVVQQLGHVCDGEHHRQFVRHSVHQ